ncbi:hypothetical protein R3P38DRAFT_3440423 [Favolaschia claudopus]|uniref:Uncharacterized protein n=1 Tax=Favolaschia claudopus TaxID=2862362 RepID=A0AAW0CWF6_9AGAR
MRIYGAIEGGRRGGGKGARKLLKAVEGVMVLCKGTEEGRKGERGSRVGSQCQKTVPTTMKERSASRTRATETTRSHPRRRNEKQKEKETEKIIPLQHRPRTTQPTLATPNHSKPCSSYISRGRLGRNSAPMAARSHSHGVGGGREGGVGGTGEEEQQRRRELHFAGKWEVWTNARERRESGGVVQSPRPTPATDAILKSPNSKAKITHGQEP